MAKKIAFAASFLAAFMTMDVELFGGDTTRFVYRGLNNAAHATAVQMDHWRHPTSRRI